MTTRHWFYSLPRYGSEVQPHKDPTLSLEAWAHYRPWTFAEAWEECPCADWMIYIAAANTAPFSRERARVTHGLVSIIEQLLTPLRTEQTATSWEALQGVKPWSGGLTEDCALVAKAFATVGSIFRKREDDWETYHSYRREMNDPHFSETDEEKFVRLAFLEAHDAQLDDHHFYGVTSAIRWTLELPAIQNQLPDKSLTEDRAGIVATIAISAAVNVVLDSRSTLYNDDGVREDGSKRYLVPFNDYRYTARRLADQRKLYAQAADIFRVVVPASIVTLK